MNGIFMLPAGGHLQPTVEEVPQDLIIVEALPPIQDHLHQLLGVEDVDQSVCEATGVVGHNVRDTMATSRAERRQALILEAFHDTAF